jgi:undecaprenyl phosphate N,N'-diacetylbacillosamine 1-phosphate transferase
MATSRCLFYFQHVLKRAADLLLSALLLVALLPLMCVIAVAVRATSSGEAIFRQQRVGKDGRLFTIYKFRTMFADAPRSRMGTHCYRDDPRLTRVGALLRTTSLDELPQLFNILKGEMSFVGPRPDLPHHVNKYTAFQMQRLRVRPGITGWAQVNGRNHIPWDQRIQLDVEYIRHWSLLRDLVVVLRTFAVVLARKGVDLPETLRDVPWEQNKENST